MQYKKGNISLLHTTLSTFWMQDHGGINTFTEVKHISTSSTAGKNLFLSDGDKDTQTAKNCIFVYFL